MREETAIFSGLAASMSICTANNYQQSYFLLGNHQSPVVLLYSLNTAFKSG